MRGGKHEGGELLWVLAWCALRRPGVACTGGARAASWSQGGEAKRSRQPVVAARTRPYARSGGVMMAVAVGSPPGRREVARCGEAVVGPSPSRLEVSVARLPSLDGAAADVRRLAEQR